MIELCCEYLSVRCICLYVLIMSRMRFRVNPAAVTEISDFVPASSKEFLDIQATIECGFTLKRVRDMIRTYSQMHHTDKYSQHSSIIWPVWLNG